MTTEVARTQGQPRSDDSESSVLGIDHVGLVVRNLHTAASFHMQTFGMSLDGDVVTLPDRYAEVQFLVAGGSRIELLAPTSEEGALYRFLDKRGEGLHHVCYKVADIHEAVARLGSRGIRMADEQPWQSPHGWAAYLHPSATHGCAVELREDYR